ncbi:MAG: hypothetical protein NW216_13795 [Hyphomicrobium sp.]|nr:hypothetical protein [Hyphomicrobium sp.]
MLQPVKRENFSEAVDILTRGFPDRSRAFWLEGLDRLDRAGWNSEAGIPLGHILNDGDRAVGIHLLPAMLRTMPDGRRRRFINWSSWYMEPDARWQSMRMLRAAFGDKDAVYTDLTPTSDVQKMLVSLGFRQLNDGLVIHALPVLAMTAGAGAKIVPFDCIARDVSAECDHIVRSHRHMNILACAMLDDDGIHPLMFKRRWYRGLPIALLIYAENNARLGRNLGAVARHLMAKGVAALIVDRRPGLDTQGGKFSRRGIKFSKGDAYINRTDYLGTELCVFDV